MSMNMSQAINNWQPPVAALGEETVRVEIGSAPPILESKDIPASSSSPVMSADVDVAEAIAVPLSNKTDDRMDLSSNIGKTAGDVAVVSFSSWEPGYLIIESFANETIANKFWGYVKVESPDTAHSMRVKIQRPLLARNSGGVQLSIGLFESGSKAADFCNSMVPGFDTRLKCIYDISTETFAKSEPTKQAETSITQSDITPAQVPAPVESLRDEIEAEQKAMADTETTSPSPVASTPTPLLSSTTRERGEAYENRRRLLQRRIPAEQAELTRRLPANQNAQIANTERNKYWAQIVLADSSAEASRRLEEIRAENKDVVGDVNSEILASASSHAKYSVRLGPYVSEDDANTVCDNLQLRGVDCLMITTR
jgi:cell division septation protein DedD